MSQNFAVILILIPLQHVKRPALQNKWVGVLRMAFQACKVLGSFEKRTPGQASLASDPVVHNHQIPAQATK